MNPASQVLVNKHQSMMPSSSGASWNSSGAGEVPDKFPDGLRVLAVDDDRTCLMILAGMLRKCKYEVTKCHRAEVALSLLRENKNGFDVVISDVHMPDMDGFKLLVHIGLEMDLPVIMLSADDSKSVVMKGVTHGACDYLIKPVSIHSVRNIWQHVVRKKKIKPSTSLDDCNRHQKQPEPEENLSSANEGQNGKITKRRKDDNEDETDERDDTSSSKKPRVVWSQELHQQFVAAVSQLGFEKAVPKKILDLMNVPGLTRENVASHLQKFRLYLRRLSVSHPSGGFMDNPDAGYGSISSHNDLDIQALAASGQLGQLPAQNFATLQAVALGRSANPKSPISVDQKNIVSFENPNLRYGQQVQNWHGQNSNIGKPTNLLHGIPTNMEPKHLVGLQRSFMNGQGLIGQSQSQNQNHISRLPVLPNPAFSQASSLVNFPKMESTGINYPLGGNLGISPIQPSYGLSNNANHNWGVQGAITNTNSMQGGMNALQHNYISGQTSRGSEVIFSMGEGSGTHNLQRAKVEKVNYVTSGQPFIPEEYNQDDLLTVVLSQQQQQQQQEGTGQSENEVGFDWHSLDNLPV